jgi:hypothetical protein
VKNTLRIFAFGTAAIAAIGLSRPVQAQDITVSTSSTSSWLGVPSYQTGAGPTTDSGGTTQDNDSWGGNADGTAGFGALGQAFEVSSSGTLANAQLVMAGAAATFNVELYNLGAASSYAGYPAAAGSAPAITQLNALNGFPNLLAAGDQFVFAGVASGQTLATLTFGGADANVQLLAGDLYMLSLDPTANADSTWWARGGTPVSAYNTGEGFNADGVSGMQNFEGKSSVRDFDMAVDVTVVPEPSTMALFSLGALAWASVRRRLK